MDTVQQQWRHVSGKRKRTSTPRPLLPNTYFREPDYGWGDFPDGNAIRCSFRGIDTTIERVFDVGTRVTYDSLVNLLLLFRERERERGRVLFRVLSSAGVEACATRSRTEREKKDCFYLLDIFSSRRSFFLLSLQRFRVISLYEGEC